jgi:hypothetical protein
MRKKTITRTFRIKNEYDLILRKEADRREISPNQLMDNILHQFTLFGRFADRIEFLNLPNRIFKEMIQHMPDDVLLKKAKNFAHMDSIDFFNLLGYSKDYDTFTHLVREFFGSSKYVKWFQCFYRQLETRDLFYLQHNIGRKWSIFIDQYLKTILSLIIKTEVESRIYDYAVTLKISLPKIRMNNVRK